MLWYCKGDKSFPTSVRLVGNKCGKKMCENAKREIIFVRAF